MSCGPPNPPPRAAVSRGAGLMELGWCSQRAPSTRVGLVPAPRIPNLQGGVGATMQGVQRALGTPGWPQELIKGQKWGEGI